MAKLRGVKVRRPVRIGNAALLLHPAVLTPDGAGSHRGRDAVLRGLHLVEDAKRVGHRGTIRCVCGRRVRPVPSRYDQSRLDDSEFQMMKRYGFCYGTRCQARRAAWWDELIETTRRGRRA